MRSDVKLERLDALEIKKIEEALKKVGAFGEVHLVVEKGRVRFVRTLKSEPIDGEGNLL
ncbi:MAG: hypothetical protein HY327_09080 [Chloroflexi bacterium]|nr:hypothetical protein [Chloroflexota bacterium]